MCYAYVDFRPKNKRKLSICSNLSIIASSGCQKLKVRGQLATPCIIQEAPVQNTLFIYYLCSKLLFLFCKIEKLKKQKTYPCVYVK